MMPSTKGCTTSLGGIMRGAVRAPRRTPRPPSGARWAPSSKTRAQKSSGPRRTAGSSPSSIGPVLSVPSIVNRLFGPSSCRVGMVAHADHTSRDGFPTTRPGPRSCGPGRPGFWSCWRLGPGRNVGAERGHPSITVSVVRSRQDPRRVLAARIAGFGRVAVGGGRRGRGGYVRAG